MFRNFFRALGQNARPSRTQGYYWSSQPSVECLETRLLLNAMPPKLLWPVGGVPNKDWTIINYVDQDPSSPGFRDYRGGHLTYDGHNGIDIAIRDFAAMDTGVPVYAAADGTVVFTHDGEFDRVLDGSGAQDNGVTVDHGGGPPSTSTCGVDPSL
jgi:murein DD-endopeptidase MepM/ murein hydrolase activator NlpD